MRETIKTHSIICRVLVMVEDTKTPRNKFVPEFKTLCHKPFLIELFENKIAVNIKVIIN